MTISYNVQRLPLILKTVLSGLLVAIACISVPSAQAAEVDSFDFSISAIRKFTGTYIYRPFAAEDPDSAYLSGKITAYVNGKIIEETDGMCREFNIRPYATDPRHESRIAGIIRNIGRFTSADEVDAYMKKRSISCSGKETPLTGEMVMDAAEAHHVPPELIVAIMVQDSCLGTAGKGAWTKNPGNVGNTDDGKTKRFSSWNDGVHAVAAWLEKFRVKESDCLA